MQITNSFTVMVFLAGVFAGCMLGLRTFFIVAALAALLITNQQLNIRDFTAPFVRQIEALAKTTFLPTEPNTPNAIKAGDR